MVLFALVVLAAPGLAWAQCNPFLNVIQVPSAPPNYTLGDIIHLELEFGAGDVAPATPLDVEELRFALDCISGDAISGEECLGFVGVPANQDDGDAITYAGGLSFGRVVGDACDAITFTANSTGSAGTPAADPNLVIFDASSTIEFDTNERCLIEFDVVINSLGNNLEPSLTQVVNAATGFDGACTSTLSASARSSLDYPIELNPEIVILKEISVDGGTTWFDANDPGSAPEVTFPSGALYRLTVENTGDVTIDNVVVNDATLGIVDFAVGTLTPGQVVVLTQAEIPALSVTERCSEIGEFENVAEVSGAVLGAAPVMDQDPAFLVCIGEPDIEIVKEIFDEDLGAFVDANSEATAPVATLPSGARYRLTVTNTGTIDLENVVVNDPTLGIVDFPVGNLAVGETRVLTEGEIPALNVAERCSTEGTFTNTADVAGDGVGTEQTVTDSDPAVLVCEAAPVRFRVIKDFTDDNPAGVEVFLQCNTGLPLNQSKVITEGEENAVTFVVTDFEPGELDCDVFETVPNGYSPTYMAEAGEDGVAGSISADSEGCHFEEVSSGLFICRITNDPDPVKVTIIKEWLFEGMGEPLSIDMHYRLTLFCDAEIVGGTTDCPLVDQQEGRLSEPETWCQTFVGQGPATFMAEVIPEFPESHCFVIEEVFGQAVEVENGCQNITVSAGNPATCTITNTVLFEGIPTLSRNGLVLLALLMLAVGLIAFRRIA